ncbi:hypothetical protein IAQ61_005561 [Plenodomus lingam]|uniref:uncharacterized protein n=1 Tax=Leptosphaeria maculans TaxID=5022 RepID=UPI003327E43C|nr:hypothetical protein IAQ61_005561 [Plenodomus lingam]
MQYPLALALLISAIGVNAAPSNSLVPRIPSIPLSIYTDNACLTPANPVAVIQIPTNTPCFNVTFTPPSSNESAKIQSTNLAALPAGCTLRAYSESNCGGNFITFDRVSTPNDNSPCRTFGDANKFIRSAVALGTCQ